MVSRNLCSWSLLLASGALSLVGTLVLSREIIELREFMATNAARHHELNYRICPARLLLAHSTASQLAVVAMLTGFLGGAVAVLQRRGPSLCFLLAVVFANAAAGTLITRRATGSIRQCGAALVVHEQHREPAVLLQRRAPVAVQVPVLPGAGAPGDKAPPGDSRKVWVEVPQAPTVVAVGMLVVDNVRVTVPTAAVVGACRGEVRYTTLLHLALVAFAAIALSTCAASQFRPTAADRQPCCGAAAAGDESDGEVAVGVLVKRAAGEETGSDESTEPAIRGAATGDPRLYPAQYLPVVGMPI